MSIRDYGLQRYHNIEKELEYRFRLFEKKDAKSYLNRISRIVNKSDFNEIEIIVRIKEPWKRVLFKFSGGFQPVKNIAQNISLWQCLQNVRIIFQFVRINRKVYFFASQSSPRRIWSSKLDHNGGPLATGIFLCLKDYLFLRLSRVGFHNVS